MRRFPSICRLKSYKSYTTASTAHNLTQRPSKLIPDYLTPTSSHLLETTLSDILVDHADNQPSSAQIQSPPQALPQGHHLVYFPIMTPPSQLASDGADQDHSPGSQWPRRLWAGGEVTFHRGWKDQMKLDGRPVYCNEDIRDVRDKGGKVFVDVWRTYGTSESGSDCAIEERRTLVFMAQDEITPTPRALKYTHQPGYGVTGRPTPKHLFNFSALTYNAHAIHLDPKYAKDTDGHRERLVHGPLSLAMMLRVLGSRLGDRHVSRLVYRNHAPLYVNEDLTVAVRQLEAKDGQDRWDVWVQGADGGLAVKGTATIDSTA